MQSLLVLNEFRYAAAGSRDADVIGQVPANTSSMDETAGVSQRPCSGAWTPCVAVNESAAPDQFNSTDDDLLSSAPGGLMSTNYTLAQTVVLGDMRRPEAEMPKSTRSGNGSDTCRPEAEITTSTDRKRKLRNYPTGSGNAVSTCNGIGNDICRPETGITTSTDRRRK